MTCPSCAAENEQSSTTCAACGTALPKAPSSVVVSVDLRPGTLFHSRYEILGPLGRGGMGMVYQARDRTLDETVAIKILRPDFADDPRMAQRFKSEIKLARRVRHRNVCAIHDFGEERGLLFISMEFIDGVDLKRLVKEKGALPLAQAYDVAVQIAEGLQAVHDAGIIHRDLKTPNIMLDAQGVARLMDFGVAKHEGAETATGSGHVLGTPDYMSPEQAQGGKVDFRCDIYALGIVVFEIFSGRVPFKGDTPLSTLLKHVHDPPPLDGAPAAGIPLALRPVLRKALAKDASQRQQSANELAAALREAQRLEARATTVTELPTLTGVHPVEAPARRRERSPAKPAPGPGAKPAALALQPWLLGLGALAVGGAVFLVSGPQQRLMPGPTPDSPPPATAAPARLPPPSEAVAARLVATPMPPATAAPHSPARPTPRPQPSASVALPRPTPASTPAAPASATPQPSASPTAPAPPPTPPIETGAGLLQISVRPWGTVSIDGRVIGQTPLDKIPLSAGTHVVRAQHPSYEPLESQVTIRAAETAKLSFDFAKDGVRRPQD